LDNLQHWGLRWAGYQKSKKKILIGELTSAERKNFCKTHRVRYWPYGAEGREN